MDDFDGLLTVTGLVEVSNNDAVSDMEGFRGLVDIGGDLIIDSNAGLATLDGLRASGLTIEGNLIIRNNPSLTSIAALNGVTVRGKQRGHLVVTDAF